MNKFKNLKALLFVSILAFGISFSCKNENLEKQIEARKYMKLIASETNRKANLPAQIDDFTIAEKVVFNSKENILTYSCRIFTEKFSVNELDELLQKIEKEQIINAENLHSDNQYYKYLNVVIQCIYKDINGKEIYRFKIKPEQYLLN